VAANGGWPRCRGGELGADRRRQAWAAGPVSYLTELAGAVPALTEARGGAVAAPLPSGQVLIAGGDGDLSQGDLLSAELFNPTTDTFSKLTGAEQSLTEARSAAVAATLPDGQVLMAGGGSGSGPSSSAELFNPATDTFTKLKGSGKSPVEPRARAVAATLPDGQVLIAGGVKGNYLSSAELFNPATDTFSKLKGAGQSLTEARQAAVAATLPTDKS
jgi:Kelch motif